jgi:hypothetical protein
MELNDIEIAYADDVNFLTLDYTLIHNDNQECRCAECRAAKILEQIEPIFQKYNMKLNKDKTTIDIMTSGSRDLTIAKTVGTHINTDEEFKVRKQKANTAFNNLYRIWNLSAATKTKTKIRFYNAFVLPILTYNIGTIPFKKEQLKKLDQLHRRHLRIIRGERWGNGTFSANAEIYELTKTRPISVLATQRRWELFGHILRKDKGTPANKSMITYYKHQAGEIRPEATARSRQLTIMPNLLNRDIKSIGPLSQQYFNSKELQKGADLDRLRQAAQNKKKWQDGSNEIANKAMKTWSTEEHERLKGKYGAAYVIFGHPRTGHQVTL